MLYASTLNARESSAEGLIAKSSFLCESWDLLFVIHLLSSLWQNSLLAIKFTNYYLEMGDENFNFESFNKFHEIY